jgi:hypothetical protein
MRTRLIISILLLCGMHTALGQTPVTGFGGCGSERTTDIDGGFASSTSGDGCIVVGLPNPQQKSNTNRRSSPNNLRESREILSEQDCSVRVTGAFTQLDLLMLSKSCSNVTKWKALLLITVDATALVSDLHIARLCSGTNTFVRRLTKKNGIERPRVLTYADLIAGVGSGPANTFDGSWA